MKKPRMNNMQMNRLRDSLEYEAIMTDLVLMGIVSKDQLELYMNRKFADTVRVPVAIEQPGAVASRIVDDSE